MDAKKQVRLPAEERKKIIFEAALKLFAKKGFEETKTREIAEAAGISEAAMFKYFTGKEDLVTQSLEYKFGCHKQANKAAFLGSAQMDGDVPEKVMREVALKSFDLIDENMDLLRVVLFSVLKEPKRMQKYISQNVKEDERIFLKIAEKGIQDGKIKDLDPHLVGPLFPVMMLGLAVANYLFLGRIRTKKEREKLVDTIIEIYLRGILKR